MVLLLVGGVAQAQHAAVIGDVEVLVHLKDQVAHVCDLALDLLRSAEQVGVVLAEVTAALDALLSSEASLSASNNKSMFFYGLVIRSR